MSPLRFPQIVAKEITDTRVGYGDSYIYYLDVPDHSRIRNEIGFELKFDLEKGIKEHISQARERFK
jgi:nucleoside-diphosphate-sugar epimerase